MTVQVGDGATQRPVAQEGSEEDPGPSPAPGRRGGRWLALLGSLVAVVLCLAIVNQLLVWRALRRLGESPLRLSYEGAVSWVPGVIHVEHAVVKPLGTSWSATAEGLRADLDITDLLRGSLRINELTANVVEWKDPKHGVVASGLLRIVARRIADTGGAFQVETAQLSLNSCEMRLGEDFRAVIDGDLRLTTIRAPHTNGGLALKAQELQLRARLSHQGSFRDARFLVSGRLGVSGGHIEPSTRLTATLQEPLEVSLGHGLLRIAGGSALQLASRTGELALTGRFDNLTLRSPGLDRELLLLKGARLEPVQFAALIDAGTEPLELGLRAAELVFDSGTDLGRLSSPLRLTGSVVRHDRPAWRISSASFELPRLHFSASPPLEPPLRALFRVRDLDAARTDAMQFQGELEMRGDRLGTLYPMLGIPPSVDLMLSPFREQPFTASTRLDNTATGVSLRELRVRTHTLELRGFLRFASNEKRGALLVVTPAATLGISLRDDGQDVTMRPPRDWLVRQRLAP